MADRFISVLGSRWPAILKGVAIILLLALAGYLLRTVDFEQTFKALPFSSADDAEWFRGPAGFTVLAALLVSIGCPRQVASFFAAYFFGLWTGFFAALVASAIACIITYSVARLFQETFKRFVKGKLDIAVRFWRENTFLATMIWRFMPAGSNLLTNLAAGALGIPALSFIVGSAAGYIPQTLVFAVVGSGVRVESGTQIAISVALFVVSALMGLALFARYRKKLRSEP